MACLSFLSVTFAGCIDNVFTVFRKVQYKYTKFIQECCIFIVISGRIVHHGVLEWIHEYDVYPYLARIQSGQIQSCLFMMSGLVIGKL